MTDRRELSARVTLEADSAGVDDVHAGADAVDRVDAAVEGLLPDLERLDDATARVERGQEAFTDDVEQSRKTLRNWVDEVRVAQREAGELGVDVDETRQEFADFVDEVEEALDALDKLERSGEGANKASDAWAGLGTTIAEKVAGVIQEEVLAAIETLREFTGALAEVEAQLALTGDASGQMEKVEAAVRSAGKATGTSSADAAKQVAELQRRNVDLEVGLQAVETALRFARVGNQDYADSAEVTAVALSKLKVPIEELPKFFDLLLVAAQKSGRPVEELADDIKNVSEAAGRSKTPLSDLFAILASLPEGGSDALSSILEQLLAMPAPTAQQQEALERLGLTFEDLDPKAQSLTEIFQALRESGAGLEDIQLFVDDESAVVLERLVNVEPGLRRLSGTLDGVGGASERAQKALDEAPFARIGQQVKQLREGLADSVPQVDRLSASVLRLLQSADGGTGVLSKLVKTGADAITLGVTAVETGARTVSGIVVGTIGSIIAGFNGAVAVVAAPLEKLPGRAGEIAGDVRSVAEELSANLFATAKESFGGIAQASREGQANMTDALRGIGDTWTETGAKAEESSGKTQAAVDELSVAVKGLEATFEGLGPGAEAGTGRVSAAADRMLERFGFNTDAILKQARTWVIELKASLQALGAEDISALPKGFQDAAKGELQGIVDAAAAAGVALPAEAQAMADAWDIIPTAIREVKDAAADLMASLRGETQVTAEEIARQTEVFKEAFSGLNNGEIQLLDTEELRSQLDSYVEAVIKLGQKVEPEIARVAGQVGILVPQWDIAAKGAESAAGRIAQAASTTEPAVRSMAEAQARAAETARSAGEETVESASASAQATGRVVEAQKESAAASDEATAAALRLIEARKEAAAAEQAAAEAIRAAAEARRAAAETELQTEQARAASVQSINAQIEAFEKLPDVIRASIPAAGALGERINVSVLGVLQSSVVAAGELKEALSDFEPLADGAPN